MLSSTNMAIVVSDLGAHSVSQNWRSGVSAAGRRHPGMGYSDRVPSVAPGFGYTSLNSRHAPLISSLFVVSYVNL